MENTTTYKLDVLLDDMDKLDVLLDDMERFWQGQGFDTSLETWRGHRTEPGNEHVHEHGHDHDEPSENPRLWRRIGGFLLGAAGLQTALESATEEKPRAAVGLDIGHTLLADVPDYLERGQAGLLPLAVAGRALAKFGIRSRKLSERLRQKITAGAMVAGNTAAMAYTGFLISENPEEYNPLEVSNYYGQDWKSYVGPVAGIGAVSVAAKLAKSFKRSSSHVDRDGVEHIELDRGDAEGRLVGAMISPATAAFSALWYGSKGIKFATNRLWKGEHAHGELNEKRARFWRTARFAAGGLALVSSITMQALHDPPELGSEEFQEAAQGENLEAAYGHAAPADSVMSEPAYVEEPETVTVILPEWDAATGRGSIWGEIEHRHPGLSRAEILEHTQEALRLNDLSNRDARRLWAGEEVLIPA